ncbi:MAG TPA: peptidoglycan editing factor PgeF [Armatimonadota bacterium]|jgi:hypothetical protein
MYETIPDFPDIPGLRHLISTREGGVSDGAFASLNLGYHVHDDPERVTENRRRLGRAAGYDPTTLVAAQQVHGTALAWVGTADRGRGAFGLDDAVPDTDGLLVSEPGVPVAMQVADCAPVLIVDPVRRVLAAVHAGWRGALAGIASAAVREMTDRAHSDPAHLLIGIGPTLCPACLEVGADVAEAVEDAFGPAVLQRGGEKPHLDIRAMIAADLACVGIDGRQIIVHRACPRCHTARYFSHRGQQGQAGRFALIAWWNEA